MKYQIIEASSASELEKNVRREIDEGWEPQGGVATIYQGEQSLTFNQARFYQAMIKETK